MADTAPWNTPAPTTAAAPPTSERAPWDTPTAASAAPAASQAPWETSEPVKATAAPPAKATDDRDPTVAVMGEIGDEALTQSPWAGKPSGRSANEMLAQYDTAQIAKLPPGEQEKAMRERWDKAIKSGDRDQIEQAQNLGPGNIKAGGAEDVLAGAAKTVTDSIGGTPQLLRTTARILQLPADAERFGAHLAAKITGKPEQHAYVPGMTDVAAAVTREVADDIDPAFQKFSAKGGALAESFMTPEYKNAINKSIMQGIKDPLWWENQAGTAALFMASDGAVSGGIARSAYMNAAAKVGTQVIGKVPPEMAQALMTQAGQKAALKAGMISSASFNGAVIGGQTGEQVRQNIEGLDEGTLMKFASYRKDREDGMSDAMARAHLADDRSAMATIVSGTTAGLSGAALGNWISHMAVGLKMSQGVVGSVAKTTAEAGASGAIQTVGTSAASRMATAPDWAAWTREERANALDDAIGGAISFAPLGVMGAFHATRPDINKIKANATSDSPKPEVKSAAENLAVANFRLSRIEAALDDPRIQIDYNELDSARKDRAKALQDFVKAGETSGVIGEEDELSKPEKLDQRTGSSERDSVSVQSRVPGQPSGERSEGREAQRDATAGQQPERKLSTALPAEAGQEPEFDGRQPDDLRQREPGGQSDDGQRPGRGDQGQEHLRPLPKTEEPTPAELEKAAQEKAYQEKVGPLKPLSGEGEQLPPDLQPRYPTRVSGKPHITLKPAKDGGFVPPSVATPEARANIADIPPPNRPLSTKEQAAQERMKRIVAHVDASAEQYAKLDNADGGRVINTDLVRELSPDYAKDTESRAVMSNAIQEPSSWLADKLYDRQLARPVDKDKEATVMFTAGGSDAGKSVSLGSEEAQRADIIYDGNMNNLAKARKRVKAALESGRNVNIQFTYRDPIDAFKNGVLPRAMKFGRAVPVEAHADTHNGSFKTVTALARQYEGDDRVTFRSVDVDAGKASNLNAIAHKRYDVTPAQLHKIAVEEFKNGRITEAVFRGVSGKRAERLVGSGTDNGQLPAKSVGEAGQGHRPSGEAEAGAGGHEPGSQGYRGRPEEKDQLGTRVPGKVQVKLKPRRADVNIGLDVNDGSKLTPDEAIAAIRKMGVDVIQSTVKQSKTEPTLVARLARPLTPDEAHAVSVALKQEAIAQVVNGVGDLHGPKAENWKPFNPEYFQNFDKSDVMFQAADPMMSFRHFSRVDSDKLMLDPNKYGTGMRGEERARIANGAPKVISLYGRDHPDNRVESGVGPHEYRVTVPRSKMYDASADKLGLLAKARDFSAFERAAKKAGFLGYHLPKGEGIFKGQARLFHPVEATRVDDSKTNQRRAQNGLMSRMADLDGTPEELDVIRNGGLPRDDMDVVSDAFDYHYGRKLNVIDHPSEIPGVGAWDAENLPIRAAFVDDIHGGQIYLVRGNIGSKEQAVIAAHHEMVGHYGLRGVLGDYYGKVMDGIAKSFPALVQEAAGRNGINLAKGDIARRSAAEELVAYASERRFGVKGNVFERIVASVRNALRDVGLIKGWNEADINALIDRSSDFVRRGNSRALRERDLLSERISGAPRQYAVGETPTVSHQENDLGDHRFSTGKGSILAQEGEKYLQVKISSVMDDARGTGHGIAMMERAAREAFDRGLKLASDVSVSPSAQQLYSALERRGYKITRNEADVNPETGNLVSRDPRVPVFEVSPGKPKVAGIAEARDAAGLRDFHKSLMGSVRERSAQMAAEVQALVDKGAFKYQIGDRLRGPKTGNIHIIEGYGVNKGRPMYRYRTSEGEHGSLFAEKMGDGWQKMSGPQKVAYKAGDVGPEKPSQSVIEARNTTARIAKFLEPAERNKLMRATAQKVVSQFDEMPSKEEMASIAYAGRAKRGWYQRTSEAISNLYGPDAPRFTALLAALSPREKILPNLRGAVKTWAEYVKAGRPTDEKALKKVIQKGTGRLFLAHVNNAIEALSHETPEDMMLSGPKVHSFYRNLMGHVNDVTLDSWMANVAGVDQKLLGASKNLAGTDPGKTTTYVAFSARVRETAEHLTKMTGDTWTPREVQETMWSWAKTAHEHADTYGSMATIADLIKDKEITNELIAASPEFVTHFFDAEQESVLRAGGYGKQLDELRERQQSAGRGDAGKEAAFAPDDRHLFAAAARLDAKRAEETAKRSASRSEEDEGPSFATGGEHSDDFKSFLSKINPEQRPLRDRIAGFLKNIGDETMQSVFDSTYGIERAFRITGREGANLGRMSARLAKNHQSMMDVIVRHGSPIWKDGAPAVSGYTGFQDIVAPLGTKVDDFFRALVARRAERLMSEGRENLFTPEEIAAGNSLWRENPEFERAYTELAKFKKGILDFAQEAGVVNPMTRAGWEHDDYVPFYRITNANGEVGGVGAGGSLGKVRAQIKRLAGGTGALGDPMENMLRNWDSLVKASLRNHAMRLTVDSLSDTGIMEKVTPSGASLLGREQFMEQMRSLGIDPAKLTNEQFQRLHEQSAFIPESPNRVWVFRNGVKEHYEVHDPFLFRALSNMHSNGSSAFYETVKAIASLPKRVVTFGIVKSPIFIAKVLVRHSMLQFLTGHESQVKHILPDFVPVVDTAKGIYKIMRNTDEARDLAAAGGTFVGAHSSGSTGNIARQIRIKQGMKTGGIILNSAQAIGHFYNQVLAASEGTHRLAVAQAVSKEGGSRLEQAFAARNVLDYSKGGDSAFINFFFDTVPFLKAGLSGASSAYELAARNPVGFAVRGAALALASAAYAYYHRDNNRYKQLTNDQKISYYHFFDVFQKGDHWQVPKGFDSAGIVSTVPEALTDAALSSENTRVADGAKLVLQTLAHQIGYDWMPQIIRPAVDVAMNRQSYSGAPILSQQDLNVAPQAQDAPYVSPTYRAIATHMPEWMPDWAQSPKQLQYLASGYFATVGDFVTAATDHIAEVGQGFGERPSRGPIQDIPGMNQIRQVGPSRRTRYSDEMFTFAKQADVADATFRKIMAGGDFERGLAYQEKHQAEIALKPAMDESVKAVSSLYKQQRQIQMDPSLDGKEKQRQIDDIQDIINQIAEHAYDLRPGGKLSPFIASKLIGANLGSQISLLRYNGLPATAYLLQELA